jgi:hypothetical protein
VSPRLRVDAVDVVLEQVLPEQDFFLLAMCRSSSSSTWPTLASTV